MFIFIPRNMQVPTTYNYEAFALRFTRLGRRQRRPGYRRVNATFYDAITYTSHE